MGKSLNYKKSYVQIDEDFSGEPFLNNKRILNITNFKTNIVYKWQYKLVISKLIFKNFNSTNEWHNLEKNLLTKYENQKFGCVYNRFFEIFLASLKLIVCLILFLKSLLKFEQFKECGIYQPLFKNDIWVFKNFTFSNFVNKNHPNEVTISHEHIHLLQHQYSNMGGSRISSENLKEEFISNSTAHYLLDRLEFEARLHEILIGIKRKI